MFRNCSVMARAGIRHPQTGDAPWFGEDHSGPHGDCGRMKIATLLSVAVAAAAMAMILIVNPI